MLQKTLRSIGQVWWVDIPINAHQYTLPNIFTFSLSTVKLSGIGLVIVSPLFILTATGAGPGAETAPGDLERDFLSRGCFSDIVRQVLGGVLSLPGYTVKQVVGSLAEQLSEV